MAIPDLDDQQLIAVINAGDVAAFEALYRRYRDWTVNLAYRFSGDRDAAPDVMQEAFFYLLWKFPGFTLTAQFKTFFYPVVRHLSLQRQRQDRRLVRDEAALESVVAPLDEPAAGQREVVLLRFVDGLSLGEIAVALGLPVGTVKSRLHNALATLREDPRLKEFFAP